MEMIKLQNLLFPDENTELYFHRTEDEVNLDGYFNLFDIAQRKKYTDLKGLYLKIKASGYKSVSVIYEELSDDKGCQIEGQSHSSDFGESNSGSQRCNDSGIFSHCVMEEELHDGEENELCIPYSDYSEGVFFVRLIRNPETEEKDAAFQAAFYGVAKRKDTNICIGMCTYKREEYVKQNMEAVARVMDSAEEVAGHISMYVVDNGKTLGEGLISKVLTESGISNSRVPGMKDAGESYESSNEASGRIKIFPNKNAGGASGFARAMLEAINARKETGFTHILLMDDDVYIMKDLFVRLYGLLCTLKEDYKDIRIGGELFRKEFPTILNARGEWSENYLIQSEDHLADLRSLKSCLTVLGRKVNDERLYTGWWCACYSLDMIEKTCHPLPLFIHEDDICFEKEHRAYKIMFLNGISVWHNGFEFGNYGANQYYHIRNKLIASSIYEPEIKSTKAAKWVAKCMIALLLSYRYKEIELISRAVADFIRGPQWLYHADAEKINSKVRAEFSKDAMKADDFSEIPETVRKRIENYRKNYSMEDLKKYSSENRTGGHIINKLTFNGWILPTNKKYKEMTLLDTPFEAFGAKNVVLFDPVDQRSIILKKDYGKFFASLILIIRAVGRIKANYDQVAKRYRDGEQSITTLESWKKYLDIE